MNIAVIPARGGSKRIPRKNIREFCGKPMIAYSIEAAIKSKLFDRIIVSTDDDEIASVAQAFGAELPFRRPPELSDDYTPTIPVIRHAVQQVLDAGNQIKAACCIYATAPFIQSKTMVEAFEKLQADAELDFAFPVTTFAFPIFRSLRLDGNRVRMFYPEHVNTRSQDLPEAFHDAGQFYWGTTAAWLNRSGIFTSSSTGVPLPRYLVQDIDTPDDWLRAEWLYRSLQATESMAK